MADPTSLPSACTQAAANSWRALRNVAAEGLRLFANVVAVRPQALGDDGQQEEAVKPPAADDPTAVSLVDSVERLDAGDRQVVGRLVEVLNAGAERTTARVVRAERLEVVDASGRVRVAVGNVAGPAEGDTYYPGVAVRSVDGLDRVALFLSDEGPVVSLTLEGNDALLLGVDDHDDDVSRSGPYAQLLDRDGQVAVGWRVTADSLERHPKQP